MTLLQLPCSRCGHWFESPDIVRDCPSCSVAGPIPFEVSGS